jgi:ubiquinone/menaquinone biosynthesis C-methylase UbiE
MNRLIEYFQNIEIDTVLDVGTGSGDFITVLKTAFPNAKITGIDPNSESLEVAKEMFPDESFIEMSAEKLNFPENAFDVVSISMAMHHLPDVQKSLQEMLRVVKSEGWIIVNELFSDNLNAAQKVHKIYHHFRSATDRVLGISHYETFKKNEILKIIENAGIEINSHFDFYQNKNLITKPEDIEERVVKMQSMLERIKGYPEYRLLMPIIDEFRQKAGEFGFQPATRVVAIGKKVSTKTEL